MLLAGDDTYGKCWNLLNNIGQTKAATNYSGISTKNESKISATSQYHGKLNPAGRYQIKNVAHFNFIITHPEACQRFHKLKLLVLVMSKSENSLWRNIIRKSWGSYKNQIVLMFILGQAPTMQKQLEIKLENSEFQDIIQTDYFDTWENLKLKSFALIKWAHDHCNNTNFVMKIDEDTFASLDTIVEYLDATEHRSNTIFGYKWHLKPVIRDPTWIKYYLSYDEYDVYEYMDHMDGSAYVLTYDILDDILYLGLTYPITRVGDSVLITGFLAEALGVHLEHNEGFSPNFIPPEHVCILRNKFTIHGGDYGYMGTLHTLLPSWRKWNCT